jgi:DNA-directed RNA polymerase alpha subunit
MLLRNSGLDRRIVEALERASITDTRQLQAISDKELIRLPGIGSRSIEAIRSHFK